MKISTYDLKVISIVSALRKLGGFKVDELALALKIKPEKYKKHESGEIAFSCSQLKIIGECLKTSHFQILALADYDDHPDKFQPSSFSEILIKFVLISEKRKPEISFTTEEMEFVISKIRARYARAKSKN